MKTKFFSPSVVGLPADHYAVNMIGEGWQLLKDKLALDIRNKGLGWTPNQRTLFDLIALDRLIPECRTGNVVLTAQQLNELTHYAFDQWELCYYAELNQREKLLSDAIDDLANSPTAIRFTHFDPFADYELA